MRNFDKYFTAEFKNGGRGPDKFDCLGLLLSVYRDFGIILPDFRVNCFDVKKINTTIDSVRPNWERLAYPEAPCAVVMKNEENAPGWCNHLGVYVGSGYFIHILKDAGVLKTRINDLYWIPRIEGYYKWRPQS